MKRIFALCMEGKGPSQIAALLEKEMVLNPTAYKQRENPMENRKIFYNTHPAIISLEVFDKVQ